MTFQDGLMAPVPGKKSLILVIDDSATHVAVVRHALESAGYDVAVASSGAEGLELAPELQPELIVMDVVMPGLNGFHATRKLTRNAATKHIPVVLASSKSGASDRVWGLRQGAVDYLVKPYEISTLLRTVDNALRSATQTTPRLADAGE